MAAQKPKLRNRPAAAKTAPKKAVPASDVEHPISKEDQLKTAQEERYENNPTGTKVDGTTARHTEPLGPPAPGQQGRPGPEGRRFPSSGVAAADRSEEIDAITGNDGPRTIKVRATRMGYLDHARRREGDVFMVNEREFSDRWMERVDGRAPLKTTTAKAALAAANNDLKALKSGKGGATPAKADDVIGADD